MLPRETTVRQLKKLRAETKGTDIGDLTVNDRLNKNLPNLQYIGNPVDMGIESWEEFSQKDSKLQSIAFKSKLVNKPLVKENKKENKKENMKDINNVLKFENFDIPSEEVNVTESMFNKSSREDIINIICDCSDYNREELEEMSNSELDDIYYDLEPECELETESVKTFERFFDADDLDNEEGEIVKYKNPKLDYENRDVEPGYYEEYPEKDDNNFDNIDTADRDDLIDLIYNNSDYEISDLKELSDEELEEIYYDLDLDDVDDEELSDVEEFESVKTFEAFSIPAIKKEEKQPEYTILGEEKEPKSDPNFGIGAVKAQEIKKISDFNLIDPPTPKERTIGGNAGVFIDNGTVKGFLNRIEGKDAYIESVDEPMVIKKFSLKDVVKTKKSE